MPSRALIVALAALCGLLTASAQARQTVHTLQPLLVQALRAGKAEGILGGPAAEFMAKRFKSQAPILVDVERIAGHAQAGCGRLRIATRQAGVIEPDAQGKPQAPADQSFAWQVNFCETGTFPVGED